MANYTPIFVRPYEHYHNKPLLDTPETAEILDNKADALEGIEAYLEENPIGEGGASALSDLTDVDVSTVEDGQILRYNAETEMWENADGGGGGSANVWEGSHAEYEEEKSQIADETTLLFNDDIGLEAESDYYSEVEQVIGTYMGKPLYRGYFNYGALPSDNFGAFVYKNHGISNIDKITNLCGIVTFSDGNQTRLPYTTTTTSASIGIIANSTQVGMLVGMDRHTASAYVFLEYTKTTDSVVGVIGGIKKGDNYSTNEQVIGTWLGKPLYRKVYDLGSDLTIAYNAFTSTNIDASNMSRIISARGLYSTGTSCYNLMGNISNNIIRLQADRNGAEAYCRYIILEYTKTTD